LIPRATLEVAGDGQDDGKVTAEATPVASERDERNRFK
jgi:hypothetical protein